MSDNILPFATMDAVKIAATRDRARRYRNQATNEFDYEFEELPLLSEGDAYGGLLNGKATIAFYADEDGIAWYVHEIYLDAYRKTPTGGHERTFIKVDDEIHDKLYLAIWSELTDGSFKDHVQAKVEEMVEQERAA